MRILLVRHGESEGNVDIGAYIEKGDSNVSLTEQGWRQAAGAGAFLKEYYTEKGESAWPVLFVSPYQRTRETLSGIVHGMDGCFSCSPRPFADWRLTEKFFGAASLLERPIEGMNPDVVATIKSLIEHTYKNDRHSARNFLGDSTKDTQAWVKGFIDGTLRRDIEAGKDNFLIVAHGAVIQAFIMSFMHIDIRDKDKIGNPHNCDVIEISGSSKNWKVTKLYDGQDFESAEHDMMAGIKPFEFKDLPPVPDFLKRAP